MDQKTLEKSLKKAKEVANKRNFKQSIDMVFGFRHLDLKKPDNHVDFYTQLHFSRGKKTKVCALVDTELFDQAKKECDMAIHADDFPKYQKEPKLVKRLAEEYDYFIAQATIMPKVAATFGKVLGSRGKMPNPKAGCVVPPNANLKQLVEKLQMTTRIMVKKALLFQACVGTEEQDEKEVIDNMLTLYNQVVSHLPNGIQNIKAVYVKLTMGPIVKVGDEPEVRLKQKKGKKETKEEPKKAKEEKPKKEKQEKKKEEPAKEE